MNKRVLKDYTDFQVDRMVFANDIKDKHVNRINEPEKCNIITVKAEDAPVVVPYANSSKEMQLELDGMISSINAIDPKEQDRIVAKDDTGFLWRFEKYCKKNDLKYNEEYLENLLEEASIIIIKLKYKNLMKSELYHDIKTVDLGSKGIYYRLRVSGFKSKKTADSFCDKLKELNQPCFVTRK